MKISGPNTDVQTIVIGMDQWHKDIDGTWQQAKAADINRELAAQLTLPYLDGVLSEVKPLPREVLPDGTLTDVYELVYSGTRAQISSCKVWISVEDDYLRLLEVVGKATKGGPDGKGFDFESTFAFFDYNAEISIVPPKE